MSFRPVCINVHRRFSSIEFSFFISTFFVRMVLRRYASLLRLSICFKRKREKGKLRFSRTLFLRFSISRVPRLRFPFRFRVSACGSALFYLQGRSAFSFKTRKSHSLPLLSRSISFSLSLSFFSARRNESPFLGFSILHISFLRLRSLSRNSAVSFLQPHLLFMHLPGLEPSLRCSLGQAERYINETG